MTKLDLSYERPDYGMPMTSESSENKQKMKECYPSISIEGDAAKALMKSVEMDQEFTATVKCRVVGKRSNESSSDSKYPAYGADGACVELEVHELVPKVKLQEDEEDESAEDAIESYKKNK